jgi:hypothetical protein
MNFISCVTNVSLHSGWRDQTMMLDKWKLFLSRDTTLAVVSPYDVSVHAKTWRCKTNIPLYIFPQDEHTARRMLYQVRIY